MTLTPDWISAIASGFSAIASIVAAIGVFFAYAQLRTSREIAQLQFEDGLAKEYRDLTAGIPTKALLGSELSEGEYQSAFDELFRYIDLSNEQVSLRQRERITQKVWEYWVSGIQANLALPAFKRAWSEIKCKSGSFQELRRLEREYFKNDPCSWKRD
jgi:hypothetical protein